MKRLNLSQHNSNDKKEWNICFLCLSLRNWNDYRLVMRIAPYDRGGTKIQSQVRTPWKHAYISQIKYPIPFFGIFCISSLLPAHLLTRLYAKIRKSRFAIFLHILKLGPYNYNQIAAFLKSFPTNTNNLYPKWIFIICYLLFWTSKLKNLSIREQRKVSKRVNFWIFQEKTPWSNAYVSQIKYSTQFLGICYIFSLLLAHSLTIVNAKIRNSRCAIFLHALKVWAGNFK